MTVKPDGTHREQSAGAVQRNDDASGTESLMEQVVARPNMLAALERVQQNGGAPGIDGMTVDELRAHLQSNWLRIKAALLADTYKPQAVRRVEIPKPDGGVRLLGIPNVTDRLIQQALLQVLTPIFDPTFSEFSFGFRPGRSAHDAVKLAQKYIDAGYDWVVDFDLAKFFDRVNHDKLMARIWLSPLLGNIMLDDLDKLLEQRGHRFCRYADDCNIYVRSQRAGDRTMSAVRRFIEGRLGLRLNEEKSKVDRPQNRKFLGFSFFGRIETKIRVAPKSLERFRDRVREITARSNGWSMERRIRALVNYVRGWMQYFRLARTPSVYRNLEGWILRRLRLCLWKQWKRPRTRLRKLRALGLPDWVCFASAMSRQGYWRMSGGPMNRAMPRAFWNAQGFAGPTDFYS